MTSDLFTYIGDTLNIPIQLSDNNNSPISLSNYEINFAVAKEWVLPPLTTLSSANTSQIVITNDSAAIISIKFNPLKENGYEAGEYRYQLKLKDKMSGESQTHLVGNIFINNSLISN